MLLPLANGISQGMLLFLVASGLTLIFGVMGILNFAQGGFFALGAYVTYTIAGGHAQAVGVFLAIMIASGLVVAALGVVAEVLLFRRIYRLKEIDALLATYALLLVLGGAITQIWGVNPLSQPQSQAFLRTVGGASISLPLYNLFLIVVGLVVALALWWLLVRTETGRTVRAIAYDRWMAAALGIRVSGIFTLMFAIGIFLAGLGGALVTPLIQIDPGLGLTFIIESFVVVIVGGLGNVLGALLAALLLGLLNSLMVAYEPALADFTLYIGMAVVLMIRPRGLFGPGLARA